MLDDQSFVHLVLELLELAVDEGLAVENVLAEETFCTSTDVHHTRLFRHQKVFGVHVCCTSTDVLVHVCCTSTDVHLLTCTKHVCFGTRKFASSAILFVRAAALDQPG